MRISLAGNLAAFLVVFTLFLLVQLPSHDWILPVVLMARVLEGVATGLFWPNLEARIFDVANCYGKDASDHAEMTGKGVSWFNLGWNVGLLTSSLVFMALMQQGWLVAVVFLPIIIQGANLLLIAWHKEVGGSSAGTFQPSKPEVVEKTNAGGRVRSLPTIAVVGVMLVFFYGISLNWIYTTTTNFLNAIGFVPMLGLLEALRVVMQTITSTWFKRGSKMKPGVIVFTSMGVLALTAAMGFTASKDMFFYFFAWFPIIGLVMGAMYAEALNMVANSGLSERKGQVMGFFESMGAMGNFSGPFLAGLITQTVLVNPYPTSFFIGTICFAGLLTALVVLIAQIMHKSKKGDQEAS
jgi:MFS family permease